MPVQSDGRAGASGQAGATTVRAAGGSAASRPSAGDVDAGPSPSGSNAPDLRCKADPSLPQQTDYAQPGPFPVGTLDVTFEDESRPIAETEKHGAAASRVLVTTIYYPAVATQVGGPFPLLMYSHGYSSARTEATATATRAASYGYVVVAPDFPLTSLTANDGSPDVNDAVNQPGDVSFLIDKVLALAADPEHRLAGKIDDKRIGALGVSLGGLTTLLVTFHPRLHDARVKVAMPIAPLSAFFAPGFYHTREVPLLLLHGDLDAFLDYKQNARRAFERAAPSARLISVAKGTHAAFGMAFDQATVQLLNSLGGAPGADPSNADGIGCGAVAGTLSKTGPEFVQSFDGPDDFINLQEAGPPPCQGDEYKQPAIDPALQTELTARSAVAFFQAHFGSSPEVQKDACRYLLVEIPKLDSVTLE